MMKYATLAENSNKTMNIPSSVIRHSSSGAAKGALLALALCTLSACGIPFVPFI